MDFTSEVLVKPLLLLSRYSGYSVLGFLSVLFEMAALGSRFQSEGSGLGNPSPIDRDVGTHRKTK